MEVLYNTNKLLLIIILNITIHGKNNDPTFLQTVHNHKYYQLL